MLAIAVVRFTLTRFIGTLVRRGLISLGTRVTLLRVIDLTLLSLFIIVSVHILTASLTPYAIIAILGLLVLTLFFYEVREFTAYITLQMFKHIRGRSVEVYLPGFTSPIKGRVIDLTPFTSVIEDMHGNKIYVANSLLINSIIREHNPSINIRLILSFNEGEDIVELFNKIKSTLKEIELGPFRFSEDYISIRSLNKDSLVVDIRLTALALPIRNPDLLRILNQLSKALTPYNPVLEVI